MKDGQSLKRDLRVSRVVLVCLVLLALCWVVLPAGANPPSDIAVNYDKTTNQLAVTITHPVADPTTHYIKNVKVNVNGKIVADTEYKSQPANDVFTYTYQVPVNPGDTVRVTATCVLAGSQEKVLEIPTPSGTSAPAQKSTTAPLPSPTKSAPGLLPFAGLVVLGIIVLNKKRG
jgi:hypothetical protein